MLANHRLIPIRIQLMNEPTLPSPTSLWNNPLKTKIEIKSREGESEEPNSIHMENEQKRIN